MKLLALFNPRNATSFNHRFRKKRFAFFKKQMNKIQSDKPIEILDIGGTESYWERMNFTESDKYNITLLNLELTEVKYKNFTSVKGNACDLSFNDNQFDIVISNSVIEHLFTKENQKKMADEVIRVGKYYFIQTPNLFFPIEPHWLFPFFQFMPFKIKVFLTNNFNLGHYKKSKNKLAAIERVNEVKLLSEAKMKRIFPKGKVYREYFLGFKKSISLYSFPEN
jgi:ubiquinone/menaquinone biosynthesis C-methylase UbiE